MADEQATTPGRPDGTCIDVNNGDALNGWARKFDATPEQIRDAVRTVGDRAADVEMHLKGSHSTTNADQQARAAKVGNGG